MLLLGVKSGLKVWSYSGFSGSTFSSLTNINEVLSGEQETRINYSCEDGIEKSVPRDHRLSSLGKPRDANR